MVNGLEPVSNREVLALCARQPRYLPAIGIYPLDAACNVIEHWEHEFPPPARFDVDAEIGMDGHSLTGYIMYVLLYTLLLIYPVMK